MACDVKDSHSRTLNDGGRFPIAGVRYYKDGRVTFKCKPGNETWIAPVGMAA